MQVDCRITTGIISLAPIYTPGWREAQRKQCNDPNQGLNLAHLIQTLRRGAHSLFLQNTSCIRLESCLVISVGVDHPLHSPPRSFPGPPCFPQ